VPIIRATEATTYAVHGSTFDSYVAPSRVETQICAWQVHVPPNLEGAPHRPTRDEVLRVLTGELILTLDGDTTALHVGDVALIPAGSELRLSGSHQGGTAWVSTTPGLEAVMGDGSRITPAWAN
jgi:quercetin dioxygenase-like cupin family protein